MSSVGTWWRLAWWYLRNRKLGHPWNQTGWRVPGGMKIGPELFEESRVTERTPWPQLHALARLLGASCFSDER